MQTWVCRKYGRSPGNGVFMPVSAVWQGEVRVGFLEEVTLRAALKKEEEFSRHTWGAETVQARGTGVERQGGV